MDQRVGHAGVLDLEAQLGGDEPWVQRHDDGTEEGGGEAGLDDVGLVGRQHRQPAGLTDTRSSQRSGDASCAVGELAVRPRPAVPGERHPAGPQPGPAVRQVAHHHCS